MKKTDKNPIPEKTCDACGETKFIQFFGLNKHALDGRRNVCQDCFKIKKKPTELEKLRKLVPNESLGFGNWKH